MAGAALVALAACSKGGTGPLADYQPILAAQLAKWSGTRPTNYAFDFKLTGFFVSYANRTIHVTVKADTVNAATTSDGGPALAVPLTTFPTIDQLFTQLLASARAGTLTAVEFDPTDGHPTAYAISGAADVSGAGFITGLVSVP
jgi:hypothetical protein